MSAELPAGVAPSARNPLADNTRFALDAVTFRIVPGLAFKMYQSVSLAEPVSLT